MLKQPDRSADEKDARYIDYRDGDDNNEGTKHAPWKHHPWDASATGRSRQSHGVHNYIFKRGVTYRGFLKARDAGTADKPIRLTSDPAWGKGLAVLSGAEELHGGWTRCDDRILKRIPKVSRNLVWCHVVDRNAEPRLVWEKTEQAVTRIPIARTPNWHVADPDDPRSEWYVLDDAVIELVLKVDGARNFEVGDQLSVLPFQRRDGGDKQAGAPGIRVLRVGNGELTVEVHHWYKELLRQGDRLRGPKATASIKSIGGTHSINRRLVDRKNLSGQDRNFYNGAVIWSERRYMPKPDAAVVDSYDPGEASLTANFHRSLGQGPGPGNRYYLEGLPGFLDDAGEYVFVPVDKQTGMLVIRLPDDRDPNSVSVELATRNDILAIQGKSYIEVSGLAFRFSNMLSPGTDEARQAALYASAVRIGGDADHITVRDSDFDDLANGIVAFPYVADRAIRLDNLVIDNNRFRDIDGAAIALGNGQSHFRLKDSGSRLVHVSVRNNAIDNIGQRVLGNFGIGSQGHAIQVEGAEVVEVAGNDVQRSYGSGISVLLGSDFDHGHIARPFLRSLVHHNRVVDTLLGVQDAGGIASWMGGPAYIFDNESGNPVGCVHTREGNATRGDWFRSGCYGVGYYLDGQYKGYVFNNIAWGKNNNVNDRIYSSVAFNEAMGFMNTVFHNTFYRFGVGLHKGMFQHNRDYYLANILADMGLEQILQESRLDTIEFGTLAFARNLFVGKTSVFGTLGRPGKESFRTLRQWQEALKERKVMVSETGTVIPVSELAAVLDQDYRLVDPAPAIDGGVKVFVPWALSGVAGEWYFRRRQDAPETVSDESIWMDAQWKRRDMFHKIPRNDLRCSSVTGDDYQPGILEDWVEGALSFASGHVQCTGDIPGKLDITGTHFLVEAVFRTDRRGTGILSKLDRRGYRLSVGGDGRPVFLLDYGNRTSQRTGAVSVADGQWHHLLVDIDRLKPHGIDLYLDGKPANGDWSGVPVGSESLVTTAPLRVGGSGANRFSGQLDFLRVAQGNLADAETSIDELYAWEFNGPFLKDRNGVVAGARRDTGAVEYPAR